MVIANSIRAGDVVTVAAGNMAGTVAVVHAVYGDGFVLVATEHEEMAVLSPSDLRVAESIKEAA